MPHSTICNLTRYAVLAQLTVDRDGRLAVRLTLKATWQPDDNGAPVWADHPRAVRATAQPHARWGEGCYPPDIGAEKRGCDVVIVGGALVPRGGEHRVAITLDGHTTTLMVQHSRSPDGSADDGSNDDSAEGVEVVTIPLLHLQEKDSQRSLVAIDWAGEAPASADGVPPSFGALPARAPSRTKHYGTMDDVWQQTRMPLPPADYDKRFANVVHPALQLPHPPAPGTPLMVEGMTRTPLWCIEMPDAPIFVTAHYGGDYAEHLTPAVDTLLIEPAAADMDGSGRTAGILETVARAALPLRRAGGHALQRIEVAHG